MPRIARGQIIADRTPQETLAEKVKAGKAVPLVSHMVDQDLLLQGHLGLVQDYAKRIKYPWANVHDLAHITQVRSVTHFWVRLFWNSGWETGFGPYHGARAWRLW